MWRVTGCGTCIASFIHGHEAHDSTRAVVCQGRRARLSEGVGVVGSIKEHPLNGFSQSLVWRAGLA
jgi:hypothetical protein